MKSPVAPVVLRFCSLLTFPMLTALGEGTIRHRTIESTEDQGGGTIRHRTIESTEDQGEGTIRHRTVESTEDQGSQAQKQL